MIESSLPEIQSVSVAIRDAVAPVFFFFFLGSILSVLVNRLGRAIDRARVLHTMNEDQRAKHVAEFEIIVRRTAWIRRSIGLITLAALCVYVYRIALRRGEDGLEYARHRCRNILRSHAVSHSGLALFLEGDRFGLKRVELLE